MKTLKTPEGKMISEGIERIINACAFKAITPDLLRSITDASHRVCRSVRKSSNIKKININTFIDRFGELYVCVHFKRSCDKDWINITGHIGKRSYTVGG